MTSPEGGGLRLLIVGPPGAGKGTQSERMSHRFAVPTISTGEIFRTNIRSGSELGRRVQSLVAAGDYVPDDLTNELVTGRLSEADADGGFILDGYPRTTDQVRYLDELLASHGHELDLVVRLLADPEELVRRLRKRALAEERHDDTEEVIRHRQEVYLRETEPLIAAYRDRGVLVEVDGLGDIDAVTERIFDALAQRGLRRTAV